ncbi:MAG: hypothetical protein ABGW77_06915 [Campylobacterales bacterium]
MGTGPFYLSGITDKTTHGTIPELLFGAFQGTFSTIPVAIASGPMIEQVKFSAFPLFVPLWIPLFYAPIGRWAQRKGNSKFWGVGFAGGTVVHTNAGVIGFVVALILGPGGIKTGLR